MTEATKVLRLVFKGDEGYFNLIQSTDEVYVAFLEYPLGSREAQKLLSAADSQEFVGVVLSSEFHRLYPAQVKEALPLGSVLRVKVSIRAIGGSI